MGTFDYQEYLDLSEVQFSKLVLSRVYLPKVFLAMIPAVILVLLVEAFLGQCISPVSSHPGLSPSRALQGRS